MPAAPRTQTDGNRRLEPHPILAVGVVLVLALEAVRGTATLGFSEAWPLVQAAVAGAALLVACTCPSSRGRPARWSTSTGTRPGAG